MMLSIFSWTHLPSIYLLWWCVQIFCLLLKLGCFYYWIIKVFTICFGYQFFFSICFANILSLSMVYRITFLSESFREQEFKFDEVQFISFSLIVHAFGIRSKKSLPNPTSQIYSPMFSGRCSIVLSFTFRSVIIWVIFVYGVRCGSKFFFFNIHIQLFKYHLLKRFSFSIDLS